MRFRVALPPRFRKYLWRTLQVLAVIFVLLIGSYFAFRDLLLHKAVEKASAKFKRDYDINLTIKDAFFSGMSSIEIHGMTLVPTQADTLLDLKDFSIGIKWYYALLADIRISDITLHQGYLQLTKRGEKRNFETLLHGKAKDSLAINQPTEAQPAENVNYAEKSYKLIEQLLNKVPSTVLIADFAFKGVDDDRHFSFQVQQMKLENSNLRAIIGAESNLIKQTWSIRGWAHPNLRTADLTISTVDTARLTFPYLPERFNCFVGFDTIRMQLTKVNFEDGELHITGASSVNGLFINHPKVAKLDVVIKQAELSFSYLIGKHYISMDSSSTVNFNGFVFHPYLRFENNPDTVYAFSVHTEKCPAQNFINALPEGLFSHIKGMEAEGSFAYRLDFLFNQRHPDEMVFESTLDKAALKIIHFGEANINKLNGEFVYTPYENGRPMRPVFVGSANPNYTPLDQVSVFLKKAILTTEDPSFYWHRGFVTEAFRQSIAKNIRTGKFKRGASTISMQLVKNVFLTREKTMSRKLEEILLVYIMENNYLVSKDRMFEVYLNIIEWGPNVYGIGEAAQFYFKKKPVDLTLSECLFLATIIPRPKGFMWRFNKDGSPKEYLEKTYRFIANKMVFREFILPQDTVGLTHIVKITGPARKYIIKNDSLVNDSVIEQEMQQMISPEEAPASDVEE